MGTRISDLDPDVAEAATKAIQAMLDRHVQHAVTSTYRTQPEQIALYAQGREPLASVNAKRSLAGMPPIDEAQNAYTVTNADGVRYRSNHQSGRALDIVPLDAQDEPQWPPASDIRWKMIAVVMKQFGFAWGGDWTKEKDGIDPDLPHYEMT